MINNKGMNFTQCCQECIANKELVHEWNRLTGHHLGERRNPIDKAIDDACGYDPDMEAMPDFVNFVYEYIWCILPDDCFAD